MRPLAIPERTELALSRLRTRACVSTRANRRTSDRDEEKRGGTYGEQVDTVLLRPRDKVADVAARGDALARDVRGLVRPGVGGRADEGDLGRNGDDRVRERGAEACEERGVSVNSRSNLRRREGHAPSWP